MDEIRVLLIEDNPGDARLIQAMLAEVQGTTFTLECRDSLSTGLQRLAQGGIDVVLSDLSLPDCQGLETFARVRATCPEVPVLVLSGLDDETLAVKAVRDGAQDYLVKGRSDTDLLQRSIRYAIERRWADRKLRESEERYRKLIDSALDAIFTLSEDATFTSFNPAFEAMTGWSRHDLLGKRVADIAHPDDHSLMRELMASDRPDADLHLYEARILSKTGEYLVMEIRATPQIVNDRVAGYFAIGRDITDRKKAQERLREMYEREKSLRLELSERTAQVENAYFKLCQLDQMKDGFLSTVSHELRTPLTSIKGFAEILLSYDDEDRETRREFLTIINNESDRLTRLINDLLDLSRIQSGGMQWDNTRLEPQEVIKTALNASHALFAQKSIDVSLEIEPDLPQVVGDRDRLVQVMTNLVGNAIKFTSEGGRIRIQAQIVREEVDGTPAIKIGVADDGIGISPEDHEKIFDKFRQIGNTLTDKPGGTGLGLAICKEIVEHHEGRIWVESDIGQGSAFYFTLPAAGETDIRIDS